jgi:hypothetical protein
MAFRGSATWPLLDDVSADLGVCALRGGLYSVYVDMSANLVRMHSSSGFGPFYVFCCHLDVLFSATLYAKVDCAKPSLSTPDQVLKGGLCM